MIKNIEKTEFIKIINNIKKDVINTRNKIMYSANRELINMYFRMGKNISENSKYGSNFVTILSKTLKLDFPNSTGFSERNLWRMKNFYEQYKDFSILPPAVAELPWTHNYILLEKIKDRNKRLWYAEECLKNGWSKNVLVHQIELKLYERKKLSNKFTNFNQNIELKNNSDLANEIIKDPYIFELEGLKRNYLEKELEEQMITKDDINLHQGHYDVAIIDIPYNLYTPITHQQQCAIIQSARRLCDKLVLVSYEKMDEEIQEAGFFIKDCVLRKKTEYVKFGRYIYVCY